MVISQLGKKEAQNVYTLQVNKRFYDCFWLERSIVQSSSRRWRHLLVPCDPSSHIPSLHTNIDKVEACAQKPSSLFFLFLWGKDWWSRWSLDVSEKVGVGGWRWGKVGWGWGGLIIIAVPRCSGGPGCRPPSPPPDRAPRGAATGCDPRTPRSRAPGRRDTAASAAPPSAEPCVSAGATAAARVRLTAAARGGRWRVLLSSYWE